MPKRACIGKTAVDSKDSKPKVDLDTQPLKDKDMNIMHELPEPGAEKDGLSKIEEVKPEPPVDVTPPVVAVKSQRKLVSSGQCVVSTYSRFACYNKTLFLLFLYL